MKKFCVIFLVLLLSAALLMGAGAKESVVKYPNGDVSFIIPAAAGGGNDLIVRALIPGMKEALGGNVIPENKPASRGAIAALDVTKAKPDGQKIYFNSQTVILQTYGGVDVPVDGFQPVAQVVEDTAVILVKADAPYKIIGDLVAAGKNTRLKISHNGEGTLWHLAAVTLSQAAKIEFQYVAYSGGGPPMLKALAAGEVDIVIVNHAESKSLIDAGRIKPLAVMSEARSPSLPDLSTCIEAGFTLTYPIWRGVFTTKGVSEEILNILEKAVKAGMEGSEFNTLVKNAGLVKKFKGHKDFTKFFQEQVELTAKLMKK
jgi:tripartite-type tricarboxylate transporter receptor subunit TctC